MDQWCGKNLTIYFLKKARDLRDYHVEYLRTLEDMDPIIKGLDKKFGM